MTNCSPSLDVPSDCLSNSEHGNKQETDIQRAAKTASANDGKQQIRTRRGRPLDGPSDRTNNPYDNGDKSHIQRTKTLPRDQEQWVTIKLVPVLNQGAAFRTLCPKCNDQCVLHRARCIERARRDERKCPMQCRGCGYKFEAPDISQHPEWEAWRHEHRTAKGPASHTELEAEASQDSTSDSDVEGYSKPSGHRAVINATCIVMNSITRSSASAANGMRELTASCNMPLDVPSDCTNNSDGDNEQKPDGQRSNNEPQHQVVGPTRITCCFCIDKCTLTCTRCKMSEQVGKTILPHGV